MHFPTPRTFIRYTTVSIRTFNVHAIAILIVIGTAKGLMSSCDTSTTSQSSDKASLCTLKLVQVIMRHGDRNPIADYPINPYKDVDKHWPGGYGQLTQIGEQQACEVGAFLRARYDGFLPREYHVDEMMAWSSYTDRSIRSGISALRGLYPRQSQNTVLQSLEDERSGEYLNLDLGRDKNVGSCLYSPTQIVPMRTIQKEEDNFIYMNPKCPVYDAAWKKFLNESEEEKLFKKKADAFPEIIYRETGLKKSGNLANTFGLLFDSLHVQKHQGKKRPTWFTPEMEKYADDWFIFRMQAASGNSLFRKFMSGIVEKILNNMEEFMQTEANGSQEVKGPSEEFESHSKGKRRQRRFILFSGHDKTIITFLNLLNIFNGVRPPYSTSVIIELHKSPQNNDYHLQIFYRNDTKSPVYPLTIPECEKGGHCFLKRFKEITTPMFPKDYLAECQGKIRASIDVINSSSQECFTGSAPSAHFPTKVSYTSFSLFTTLTTLTISYLFTFI